MKSQLNFRSRVAQSMVPGSIFLALLAPRLPAQTNPNERVFPQSKATVEQALKALPAGMAGHLPALEGFAQPGEHPLDRYERGYYQTTAQVSSTASGGSLVRVTTKVTAWYKDPVASRSGYRALHSNGRLEADLLDLLTEQLARGSAENGDRTASVANPMPPAESSTSTEPKISAPSSTTPGAGGAFSMSSSQSLAAQERASARPRDQPTADKAARTLQEEAINLEEILKNQAHPKNLVAVRKSGTPVVDTPSLTAKPQFLASMHDEFEMLDFNADWVHVRISGLSRGWIWRNSVEMPEGIPDTDAAAAAPQAPAADLFRVLREDAAQFPGDWEPLRGKNVKIITVQKMDAAGTNAGPRERLEYAKFLLGKNYVEMTDTKAALKPPESVGIVLIFDSADGGMIAATLATLQQWKAGKLTDSALWHKCFFDPPETFEPAGSSPSQQ